VLQLKAENSTLKKFKTETELLRKSKSETVSKNLLPSASSEASKTIDGDDVQEIKDDGDEESPGAASTSSTEEESTGATDGAIEASTHAVNLSSGDSSLPSKEARIIGEFNLYRMNL